VEDRVSQETGTTVTARPTRFPAVAVVVITVLGTVASLGLGRVIWPDPPGAAPPGNLVPLFIVIGVLESLSFGLGLSFLLYGWPRLRRLGYGRAFTAATYLSIAWLMVSWWPHDNLHRVLAHDDWAGLLRIEYGFHVTLIAAGAVVAWYFVRRTR
jgi:hypothetical protein